jgi:hypothetical protein
MKGRDYQWLRVGWIISDYVLEGLSVITCGMDYQWLRVGGINSDYVWEGLSVIVCVFIIFNCSCTDLRKYSNLLKRQNICFVRGVFVKREAIYIQYQGRCVFIIFIIISLFLWNASLNSDVLKWQNIRY